jgi:hypothetical protein
MSATRAPARPAAVPGRPGPALARPTTASGRPPGVAPRPSAATFWRRRLTVLAALVALAFLLTVAVGRVGAQAELRDRVAGHVVLQPGQTLWEVAVATAPEGMDVRRQLADIEVLNDLKAHEVDAWTVVLLPAR